MTNSEPQNLRLVDVEPVEPPPRKRSPKDDVFDVLTEHFGSPRTRTETKMFGQVCAELLEAGATPQETQMACLYVLRNFDSPSVFAVTKWFSKAITAKPKPSAHETMLDELRRNS